MFCSKCSQAISQGSRFCARCGAPVSQAPSFQTLAADPTGMSSAFDRYKALLESRLGPARYDGNIGAWVFYSEEFKISWGASKLKRYVFLTKLDTVDGGTLSAYSHACMDYALKIYQGLPRGLQNGVASLAVAAGELVTQDAIFRIQQTPPAHFAALEMPIAVDLRRNQVYMMQKTPVWGCFLWRDVKKFAWEAAHF